jgi:hypothetical protein
MSTKYLFYTALLLAFIGILVVVYLLARRPFPPPSSETSNHYTTLPVQTKIIYKNLPGKVVIVDGHEVASIDTLLTSPDKKTTIDLGVRYDEQSNLFDLDTTISTTRDSIYIEKIIDRTPKPKFIGFTTAVGVGFNGKDGINPDYVCLDAGIKFLHKYNTTLYADTRKTFGVRFGVDF